VQCAKAKAIHKQRSQNSSSKQYDWLPGRQIRSNQLLIQVAVLCLPHVCAVQQTYSHVSRRLSITNGICTMNAHYCLVPCTCRPLTSMPLIREKPGDKRPTSWLAGLPTQVKARLGENGGVYYVAMPIWIFLCILFGSPSTGLQYDAGGSFGCQFFFPFFFGGGSTVRSLSGNM